MELRCSICNNDLKINKSDNMYPNKVCIDCDEKALNIDDVPANTASEDPLFLKESNKKWAKEGKLLLPDDGGDNPVFIDGIKCWRRYRLGGYITMRDNFDCQNLDEFYDKTYFFEG